MPPNIALSKKRTTTTRKKTIGSLSQKSDRALLLAISLVILVVIQSYNSNTNNNGTASLLTNLVDNQRIHNNDASTIDSAIAEHKAQLLENRAAALELRRETPSQWGGGYDEGRREKRPNQPQNIRMEDQLDARILEKRRKADELETQKQIEAEKADTTDNSIQIMNTKNTDNKDSTESNNSNNNKERLDNSDETAIRKWGCARNETPFIFVHIGKAGGGGVRSRMAAAALDYNRTGWHRTHQDEHYYYPIYADHMDEYNGSDTKRIMHKAKFLSSKHSNYIHPDRTEFHGDFTYEGHGPCGAGTPIGQAVACPIESTYCVDHDEDGISEGRCDLVYMGHNLLGSELHWLPTQYLVKWWNSTWWGKQGAENNNDALGDLIANRHTAVSNTKWPVHPKVTEMVGEDAIPTLNCDQGPYTYRPFLRAYKQCFQPKEEVVDLMTRYIVGDEDGSSPGNFSTVPYAEIISSMPVLRVTVLRDPFSWLTSKFFWHGDHHLGNGTLIISDMGIPDRNKKRQADWEAKHGTPINVVKCDNVEIAAAGWATNRAMSYIFYLCGEHCMGGWANGSLSLADLEQQAAYNLRNSFAVVGLLQKTDDFYKMVSQRVFYMDTSLNPEVEGKTHATGRQPEIRRCKEKFQTKEFQEALLEQSPAMATLNRLYKIAVEVNEFQTRELSECSTIS